MYNARVVYLNLEESYVAISFLSSSWLKKVKMILSKYIIPRWRKDLKRKYTFVKCCCDDLSGTPKAQCYDKMYNSFSKLYQCHGKTKESFFLVFYISYQPILFVWLLYIYLYIWKMCLISFFSFCMFDNTHYNIS